METELESYMDDHRPPSAGANSSGTIRRLFASDGEPGSRNGIYVNQQQIDRVGADSLEDVKAEQADDR